MLAQSAQFNNNDDDKTKREIIFVYAPNVPNTYHYCIAEFISFHFDPKQVICFDVLMRGRYVQNFDELEMPQIRKLCTSHFNDNFEEKKSENDDKVSNKMEFVDNIKYLETGNLITSLAASLLQQCEYNGIKGSMFVSISDLDYLTESLISFGNILIDYVGNEDNKLKKSNIIQKCAKYGNKNGYLLTGRDMFV